MLKTCQSSRQDGQETPGLSLPKAVRSVPLSPPPDLTAAQVIFEIDFQAGQDFFD
jgi:hypothetical protein